MRVAWLCMLLVSVAGFAGDSNPGVFGFDGDGKPVLAHKGNSQMLRWQDGAFVPVSPPFRTQDGCTSAVAALTDGTLFLLGTTSGDTGPSRSNVFRAQPAGNWAPAFAQTVDLGKPEGAVRDAQGHIWLLGLKGVARVAPDGQSVSVIADCSHPLYEGCQRALEGHAEVNTTYPGVVPAGNFYFTLRRRVANHGFERAVLYRVSADTTEPQLFSLSPPGGAPVNGDGDNFHVYLSNQGRVFLVESGSVSEEGAYELIRS